MARMTQETGPREGGDQELPDNIREEEPSMSEREERASQIPEEGEFGEPRFVH